MTEESLKSLTTRKDYIVHASGKGWSVSTRQQTPARSPAPERKFKYLFKQVFRVIQDHNIVTITIAIAAFLCYLVTNILSSFVHIIQHILLFYIRYIGPPSKGSIRKLPPLDQRQRTKAKKSRRSTFPASLTLDQLDLDKNCGSGIYHLIPCKSTSG